MKFTIEAVCISDKKGVSKHSVKRIRLVENFGIKKDAHAGIGDRQVSLLAAESIEELRKEGLDLKPGAFGENIVTRGLDGTRVKVGGQIIIGEAALEVTHIGKICHNPCAIFHAVGRCIMPERGIFAKVKKGGAIHARNHGHYGF